jgi:branched-chain amino acid aminotransferase
MQSEIPSSLSNLIHNGVLCHAPEARVAMTDGAIRWGQGVFETLAAYDGRPFLTESHLERLRQAAGMLDLHCPFDTILIEAMDSVLQSSGLDVAGRSRLRITLTSPTEWRSTPPSGPPESWFIEASPLSNHPERAAVVTIPFVRNDRSALTGLKTINYGENVIALKLARESGADEALFANTRDLLCEGTWSNIFVHHEGTYLTPPLSSGCLPGVTRALVLDLCRDLGITVREVDFPMGRLAEIEGAFLTSSLREIQIISSLNGRPLNDPPGVALIKAAYRTQVERYCRRSST